MHSRVHQLFAAEMTKHQGDELIEYLLEAAPTYERLLAQDPRVSPQDIQQNMGFSMNEEVAARKRTRQELTPFGCPCSKHAHVCVDTELACLVCMTCGRHSAIGFHHGYRRDCALDTKRPFTYRPVSYLSKHLDRLAGYGYPTVPVPIIRAIRNDLREHGHCLQDVTPADVYQSLRRLNKDATIKKAWTPNRFYPHRWALTQHVNPAYTPLDLDDHTRERLLKVFTSCYNRFARQRPKTKRKRKFFSYLLFIQRALLFLRVPGADTHFNAPGKRRGAREQRDRIDCLLRGDTLPK